MKYQNHEQREIAGRQGRTLRRVLFVCQDNYALSRFAEEYFNSLVRDEGLNWQASSRAALPANALPADQGAMADEAVRALRELRAAPVCPERAPSSLSAKDVGISEMLIAVGVRGSDLEQTTGRWARAVHLTDWELPSGLGARDAYLMLAKRVRALVATLDEGRAIEYEPGSLEHKWPGQWCGAAADAARVD